MTTNSKPGRRTGASRIDLGRWNPMRSKYALATVLALSSGVALAGCNRSDAAETETSSSEVVVVERRDLNIQAEAAGTVEPIRVVEVKSKASGEVLDVHAETGDKVPQGTLLAEIDPRDVRNAYEQAAADLDVAQARFETSSAQLKRTQELRQANVVTEQELETARLDEANSKAQLVKAKTNLQLAQERLSDVTIRAPIAGTIIVKNVEPGVIIASASANVSGGTTLMTMADLSEIQVRTLVDETDIGKVKPGQPADVTVEAYPGRHFDGKVYKIEPQAIQDQNVTMFPVLIRLPNSEGLLQPGMNAEVTIRIAQRQGAIAVPNAAIVAPKDIVAAASVLGLDMSSMGMGGRPGDNAGGAAGTARAGGGAGRPAAAGSARPGGSAGAPAVAADDTQGRTPAAAENGATAGLSQECAALRDKLRSAGGPQGLSEADRATFSRCREQFRAARGGGRFGAASSNPAAVTAAAQEGIEPRPGFVFVQTPEGPEARRVLLGLYDWDYTEVLSGVEPGDKVILMSVARMQQQQEEMTNRIRQRASGPLGGGGRR